MVHCKRIIPCLDGRDGRVVKGVGFSICAGGDTVELAARAGVPVRFMMPRGQDPAEYAGARPS